MIEARGAARRRADDVWNAGLDVVDELFSPTHRHHDPLMPDLPPGPAGVHAHIDAFLTAMPDALVTVDEWIEGADSVVARWTISGTHTGELLGMPPSGRCATMTGTHVFRFVDDQIVETWISYDAVGLLRQLGLVTLGIALNGPVAPKG